MLSIENEGAGEVPIRQHVEDRIDEVHIRRSIPITLLELNPLNQFLPAPQIPFGECAVSFS